MSKNLYIHCDLETTSLNALTGHIRSIGWVVTDGSLTEVDHGHIEQPIPAEMWDAGTWKWATENYPVEYLQQFQHKDVADFAEARWRHYDGEQPTLEECMWVDYLTNLLEPFYAAVKEMEAEGHKCWLIANHPDFDATMLRAASKITGLPFPFRYNRVLDMASLMMGHYNANEARYELGPQEPSAILNALGFTKEAVQHTALEDAKRQVEILKAVGLRLPL